MLRKFSVLMLSFMLVAAANTAAQGQHGNMQADRGRDGRGDYGGTWSLLGERHIDGRADNDKIDVGRDNGRFRAIQFRVQGGTVMFDRIRVKYLNGESDDISVRSEIPDGGRTRDRERVDVVQQAQLALASPGAGIRHSLARRPTNFPGDPVESRVVSCDAGFLHLAMSLNRATILARYAHRQHHRAR